MISRPSPKLVWVFAAVIGGAAVILVARALVFSSDGATAIPELEIAASDAEWLDLISSAAEYRENPSATWPEPAIPAGVRVLRSCAAIPNGATQSQMAIAYSPDESRRRVTFAYFEPPDRSYELILYSDGDTTGCDQRIVDIVKGPDTYKESVDSHICSEMSRMADGLQRSDQTLRAASPEVAKAYRQAFCK